MNAGKTGMVRPLALVGFTYLLTLAAAISLPSQVALLCGCVCAGAFALLHLRRPLPGVFLLALLSAAFAFGSVSAFSGHLLLPAQELDGRDVRLEGVFCEAEQDEREEYGKFYDTLEVRAIDGVPVANGMRVRLSSANGMRPEPYARLIGRVHCFLPERRAAYAAKGIAFCAYLYEYEPYEVLPPEERPLYAYALRARQALLESIRLMLPSRQAGLLGAVLFGEKSGLPSGVEEVFRTAGMSHIMAVSGLHLSAFAAMLLALGRALGLRRRGSAAAASLGVFAFMAVACFSPSVTRSGIMCLLLLGGSLFARQADAVNSLGLAVFLLCLQNPFAVADVGLQLSFSATLGLLLLTGPFQKALCRRQPKREPLRRLWQGIAGILSSSMAALLFTLPVLLLTFRQAAPYALLANLLVLWPASLLVPCGALAAVLFTVQPYSLAALPLAWAADGLTRYLLACAEWVASLPFAGVSASLDFLPLWIAASLVLLALCILWRASGHLYRCAGVLSAILLLAGLLSAQMVQRGVVRVAVLDTGGGISMVLTRDGEGAVIGCAGYRPMALDELRKQNIPEVAYIQLLSDSDEECQNAAVLAAHYSPGVILMPETEYLDDFLQAALYGGEPRYYQDQAQASLWDDCTLEVRGSRTLLTVRGVTFLLLPEGGALDSLPPSWREPDFLVTADSGPWDGIAPFSTILALRDEEAIPAVQNMEQPLSVSGGTIVLDIRAERTVTIRRER